MSKTETDAKIHTPTIVGHIEQRPVNQLKEYTGNPRTHCEQQIEQIAASIREFGFVNPVLIATNGEIIAGHARLSAARKIGMAEVPVIVLAHLSPTQRRALAVADNRLPLSAGWDEQKLHLELAALRNENFDLQLMGFDDAELARLLAARAACAQPADADLVPPKPRVSVTRPGDLWTLGDHRLLCGDATCKETIDIVLGSEPADMVFTDPPYDPHDESVADKERRIQAGAVENSYEFLRKAFENLITVSRGAIYICMTSTKLHTFYRAFTEAGGQWSTFLVWVAQESTRGSSDYQRQYAPILYGWPKDSDHYWCGARDEGDVWYVAQPVSNREYPTAKPVELVERAVKNSSKVGGTVLDPFAGSGTTLIACEQQKRRARLIEIDPACADVICARWNQFTGKQAVLAANGRAFKEIASERQKGAA